MLKNYLKIALRNLKKFKVYSFINITGLAIGMACCLLILLWVQNELSYDSFHKHANSIYRVVQKANHSGRIIDLCRTPPNLSPVLKKDYPEVSQATRCWYSAVTLEYEQRHFKEETIFVDPDFLTMFSFSLIHGDPATAFKDKESVILSARTALKIFGHTDCTGKVLRSNRGNDHKVTGVVADIPKNSHLRFDYLFPIFSKFGAHMWAISNNPMYTYVKLKKDISPESLTPKIKDIITKNSPKTITSLYLQPLKKIHLYSQFTGDVGGHGDIKYVYIFFIVALFILIIACVNFMNLTTARSGNRAKEVGLRKVVGAERSSLIMQFFGEAILLSLIALILAITLVFVLLPIFNNLSGKELSLELSNFILIGGLFAAALVTGLFAGSYPALFLSSFQPMNVLKGRTFSGGANTTFRKILVIFQFTLSIILLFGTIVVLNQLEYIRNKKLGYAKNHSVYFSMTRDLKNNYSSLKNEMLRDPNILKATYASHIPTDVTHVHGNLEWEGKDPNVEIPMNCLLVDHDYVKTMGMEVLLGRDFTIKMSTDEGEAFIINESAQKLMGLEDPIGKKVVYAGDKGRIIGVLKDFHFKPLSQEIEPMILINSSKERFYLIARISPTNISAALNSIKIVWNRFLPKESFEYGFLDETLDKMYRNEERVSILFNSFTILAIFISCLGLLGLVSFMAEQRTREIGIRKVLGASVSNILWLISKEFAKWILIANLVAWPIAYFIMNRWLENFAYRIQVGLSTFILSALLAFVIAILTIGYQSIKAANTNPVDALKCE